MMKRHAALALLVLVVPATTVAQTSAEPDTERRLRALEAQVEALMAEVSALRAAQSATSPSAPSPPAVPQSA